LRVVAENPSRLVDRQEGVVLPEVTADLDTRELLGDEVGVAAVSGARL
jgi:hypothetical protein